MTVPAVTRSKPTALGWTALVTAFRSTIVSVIAMVRRDRRWPTVTALVVGGIPTGLWLAFLIGEIFFGT